MAKALLLSIVFALTIIPARAARDPHPPRGLRKAIRYTIWFNLFYLFAVMYLWGRLV